MSRKRKKNPYSEGSKSIRYRIQHLYHLSFWDKIIKKFHIISVSVAYNMFI